MLALLVAAGWSDAFSRVAWRRIGRAMRLWATLAGGRRVPHGTYDNRLACCRACPLWYAPLETCGSPFKSGATDLGCWCFMPQKAKYYDAVCWMDAELGDAAEYGWQTVGVDPVPRQHPVGVAKTDKHEQAPSSSASAVPLGE